MTFKLKSTIAILLGLIATSAGANPLYLNAGSNYDGAGGAGFVAYYNSRQAGVGDTLGGCFNCFICHTGIIPTEVNLNTYATDWLAAWAATEPNRTTDQNPDALAVAAWKTIEAGTVASGSTTGDSDGDGTPNGQEIFAGSNPGDPTSTPTHTNCQNSGQVAITSNSGPSIGTTMNLNALNSKCGFQSSGAGMIQYQDESAKDLEEILLFFLPLFTLFYLRTLARRRAKA